ncbi:MAG: InlB B-repeat-containing protein [Kiritimatiellae bacterium]|nr:InlB B-repeat-containing protein [Kiritimatiellia bacterium]
MKMWCANTNQYNGAGIQDVPEEVEPTLQSRIFDFYPAGHPFESWARRDITCLLPNGKFCGVDEELGLVVVNPLTGEMYVASDDPVFKKGKMGCQLLPNGKVWIIPYDCEGREYLAGTDICGKLYEVDFGFTKSFSLSSLCSPYLKVAEGDPEPSGIKVGLDPNGGELPGVYAQYYKGTNPVYGTLPTPTRSGHAFRGWSTDGTEAGIVGAGDPVPGSGIQLKAVWRAQ